MTAHDTACELCHQKRVLANSFPPTTDLLRRRPRRLRLRPRPAHPPRHAPPLLLRPLRPHPPRALQRHRLLRAQRLNGKKQVLRGNAHTDQPRDRGCDGDARGAGEGEWWGVWGAGRMLGGGDGAGGSSGGGGVCGVGVRDGQSDDTYSETLGTG